MKVGIDLGTTYSAVAICEEQGDHPVVTELNLDSADNKQQLASAVYIAPDGHPVVGSAALNALHSEPQRVFQWFKRQMGDEFVTDETGAVREVDGARFTPQQLSAEVLKVLKKDAECWLGEPISGAVVCVPAWFGDRQREATRQAMELAGLPLIRLLAEPSAAALAVAMEAYDAIAGRDALVYDLGGGTFDVVLIRTKAAEGGNLDIETLCRDGHFRLGGHDWDLAVARHLCRRCFELHGHNPESSDDRREWPVLLENIEREKRYYSQGRDPVQFQVGLRGHALELSLDEFNEITGDLLGRTREWVEKVLADGREKHGMQAEDLVAITCGGASKLPAVTPMLTELVGHPPLVLRRRNPETMVVRGAAYAAFLETNVKERYRPVGVKAYTDTTPEGDQYINRVILPDGVAAEEKISQQFEIAEDDQTELVVVVLQGDSEDVAQSEVIGEVVVTDLPPGRKAGACVTVAMWYDINGILHATATDESGATGHATIMR